MKAALQALLALQCLAPILALLPVQPFRLSSRFSNSPMKMSTSPPKRGVCIIGGGPAGLAAAILLARRGWRGITVIEKAPDASFADADKSFTYRIDARGQQFTDAVGITEELQKQGVVVQRVEITLLEPTGRRLASFGGKKGPIPTAEQPKNPAVWCLRPALLDLLRNHVTQNWRNEVSIEYDTKVIDISRAPPAAVPTAAAVPSAEPATAAAATNSNSGSSGSGGSVGASDIRVTVRRASGEVSEMRPTLVIGADGLRSTVREALARWHAEDCGPRAKNPFAMQEYVSGSSYLCYKVLTIPARFPLDNSLEEFAEPSRGYVMVGVERARLRRVRLGMLPTNDKYLNGKRTANFISFPDHVLFGMTTGEEVLDFFEKALPHVPVREILPPAEAERFAKARGGRFVPPQCCDRLQWLLSPPPPQAAAADGDASGTGEGGGRGGEEKGSASGGVCKGVVLVGDAIHAFPPDLGAGVNSALEDVMVLSDALADAGDRLDLALPAYQKMRWPDSYALTRMVQCGFPWQYQQNPLRTKLWGVSFLVRTALNKLFPRWFPPELFLGSQDASLRFSTIWAQYQSANRRILGAAALAGTAVLLGLLKRWIAASATASRFFYAVGL